jgi:hypothetical protein
MKESRLGAVGWTLAVLGALAALNGAWALFGAGHWFARVAADTGPLNVHFVRDVGAAYLTAGASLLGAAFRPAWRAPLTAAAACFLSLHALGHVFETAVGQLGSHHWLEDAPGVFLPALLVSALAYRFIRESEPRAS